jgi:hypothetical protein
MTGEDGEGRKSGDKPCADQGSGEREAFGMGEGV